MCKGTKKAPKRIAPGPSFYKMYEFSLKSIVGYLLFDQHIDELGHVIYTKLTIIIDVAL